MDLALFTFTLLLLLYILLLHPAANYQNVRALLYFSLTSTPLNFMRYNAIEINRPLLCWKKHPLLSLSVGSQ